MNTIETKGIVAGCNTMKNAHLDHVSGTGDKLLHDTWQRCIPILQIV